MESKILVDEKSTACQGLTHPCSICNGTFDESKMISFEVPDLFNYETNFGDETFEINSIPVSSPSTDEGENAFTIQTEVQSDKESICNNESEKTFNESTQMSTQLVDESNTQEKSSKSVEKIKEEDGKSAENQMKYKCHICGKFSNSLISLKRHHMPSHFNNTTCNICGKNLSTITGLQFHLKVTHKQGKNLTEKCSICDKMMLSRNLDKHLATHGPRDEYKCNKCGKVYLGKKMRDTHVLTHAEDFIPLLCRHCGKAFDNRIVLLAHEKKHTTEKKYRCSMCSFSCRKKYGLDQHIQTHSKERAFVCDICGKDFKRVQDLNDHLKIHKEVKEKGEFWAKCDHCGKLLKNSFRLKEHIRKMHLNKKIFKCPTCKKLLFSLRSLAKHEKTHKITYSLK